MRSKSPFVDQLGEDVDQVEGFNPEYFRVMDGYSATSFRCGVLTPKVKELVALAVNAAPSNMNRDGIAIHVKRAREEGASADEIADALVSISPLGGHIFNFGIPILLDELRKSSGESESAMPPISDEARAIKDDFVQRRGYWTDLREMLACLVPEYFKSYMALSSLPWRAGALEPKVRELLFIAIDCSLTHMYEEGLRLHIRNALKFGASRSEILEVMQIAASIGAGAYAIGMQEFVRVKL